MPAPDCTAHLLTPPHSSGAIAVIQLLAADEQAMHRALSLITQRPVLTNEAALRDLAGIDKGIVARHSETVAYLMPHGGATLVRLLMERLNALGFPCADPSTADPLALFPEAQDLYEACALDAISRAPSALAAPVLLRQAALWRNGQAGGSVRAVTEEEAARLNHLLTPPTVVAVGASNIGKSTLMNALARRTVATVADEAATTRDAVGVSLDLAGLSVTWLDTAGQGTATTQIDRQAEAGAAEAAGAADLVISCADSGSEFLNIPHTRIIRCATRCDIAAREDADIQTAAVGGIGLEPLAVLVRDRLLPPALLTVQARWAFHPALV